MGRKRLVVTGDGRRRRIHYLNSAGWTVQFSKTELLAYLEQAMLHCNGWNHTREGNAVEVAIALIKRGQTL